MRTALGLCLVIAARAELARAGACGMLVQVSPAASPMPRDGLVLVEVVGQHADVLAHAHFVTPNGDVPARVVRQVENGRLQALLAPARALSPGQIHVALGLADIDRVLATEPIDVGDATAPTLEWKGKPSVVRAVDIASNKGDGTHAMLVKTPVTAPGWVVATITADEHSTDVIYPIANGTVTIGTAGCFSAYFVDHAGAKRVELTAIGAAGRSVAAPGPITLHFR